MTSDDAKETPPLIEWTGERCVPWADDIQVIYEHYHRYVFAATVVGGQTVLDLASGEGYGAALLATQAHSVVGIDIDDATVRHSRQTYQLDNLEFRRGDMLDLSSFSDASFDVVVCFEAIEHVVDHQRLMDEATRVLRPDGLFIISTPDRFIYTEHLERDNPFHLHELSRDELADLLGKRFAHQRIWAQGAIAGSVVVPVEPNGGSGMVTTLSHEDGKWIPSAKFVAPYLLAVASNRVLPDMPDYSTLADPAIELAQAIRVQLAQAVGEQDELRQQLAGKYQQIEFEAGAYNEALRALQLARHRAARSDRRQRRLLEALEATKGDEVTTTAQAAELALIKESKLFRAARLYWGTLDRFVPPGSVRRLLYNRMAGTALASPAPEATALPGSATGPVPRVPPLPTADEPEVSVIIPVYNNWLLTAECLRSIANDVISVPFEVIVVDDGSDDQTAGFVSKIGGITLVSVGRNRGFVKAVNHGIAEATGRFVVLLNNDTVVCTGWLDALAERAENDAEIGVVGAKLVYPDGRLQEAGGIVWRDGSAWNYGRGEDPGSPVYNFPRDVDYCSGACLLVRREILESLGGLDTRYAPAYYEDVDLAFAARKLGYRVVYEPRAVVQHVEGATSGVDAYSGVKRQQEVNREVFRVKWQAELEHHRPNDPSSVRLSSWRSSSGRALVVDNQIPTPDHDAGSRRMFELLSLLADLGFAVTFVPHSGADVPSSSSALRNLGIEVLPGQSNLAPLLEQLGPDLRVAILSRPMPAWPYLPLIRQISPTTKVVYDTVDLHFLREQRRADIEGDPAASSSAELHRYLELTLARGTDATLVVSEVERDLLLAVDPDLRVYVVPTVHRDQHPGRPFVQRKGLLFVGSFLHPPNADAVRWLLGDILPHVRQELPGITTSIVGSYPPDEVRALARDDVHVLGWVPDLDDLYEQARVFVAPIRYGAGIKGKIGESLAHGLPVVTTRLGAEGMGLVHEHDILVADTAPAFATAIARCYTDEKLWARLAANGRQSVARRYSPTSVRSLLAKCLVELGVVTAP